MTQTLVLIDGSVYSPVDPCATAILISGSRIDWVGLDSGANSILDPTMDIVELGGKLATPGFVAGGINIDSVKRAQDLATVLPKNGYTGVTFFTSAKLLAMVTEVLHSIGMRVFGYQIFEGEDEVCPLAHGIFIDPWHEKAEQLMSTAISMGKKVSFDGSTPANIDATLNLISKVEGLTRLRSGFRLDGVRFLSENQLNKVIDTSTAIGFSSDLSTGDSSLRRAVVQGATVVLGSDPCEREAHLGWDLCRASVIRQDSNHQISARAAFNSVTRGVYRALGESDPTIGQLVPGAPADLALWSVNELMVQIPDSRVAAWSTDPRARIPLLPVLEEGALPRCTGVLCDGQGIYSQSS